MKIALALDEGSVASASAFAIFHTLYIYSKIDITPNIQQQGLILTQLIVQSKLGTCLYTVYTRITDPSMIYI